MKPFFNVKQDLYHGEEPNFYDVKDLKWISVLEDNYQMIKQEFKDVYDQNKIPNQKSYHTEVGWKQIKLKIYGVPNPHVLALFPKTMKIVNQIEGVSTVYFSMLKAGSKIGGHVGDTDAFYRVHLGLDIPTQLPECGIQVAGLDKSWENGKCLVFNDVYYHKAWNNTTQDRIVLIIDVIRKPFLKEQNYVNAGVRATLYFARLYKLSLYSLELLPRILQRAIHPVLHFLLYQIHSFRFKQK